MKNKKLLLFVLITVLLLFFCYFSIQIVVKSKQKVIINATAQKLPTFSKKDSLLIKKISSVFIAFHPDCEHCQYEAKSINERYADLQNTNVVLFTSANDSLTKAFSHTYGLDTLKNVHVLSDEKDEMHKLFGVKTIPTIFIYNKEGNLMKQYKGETKIDAIIKAIQ